MPYLSYPGAADVENWLRSTAFWPTDNNAILRAQSQAGIAAAAAAQEWETLTGWSPFLADSAASERKFAATDHNGFLDFEGGAIAITSVSLNGSALDEDSYLPYPANRRGKPYTGLELGYNRGYSSSPLQRPISVVARWGYSEYVPPDAWQAILQRAGIATLKAIPNQQGIASISQEGFSKGADTVGVLTQKDIAQGGDKDFGVIAGRYARVVC